MRIIPVTLAIASLSLAPLVLSDKIHARSFALLTHRLGIPRLSLLLMLSSIELRLAHITSRYITARLSLAWECTINYVDIIHEIEKFTTMNSVDITHTRDWKVHHYQLKRHTTHMRLKNSPLSIISTYSVMYIYSSFSFSVLPPYSPVVLVTLTKVKAVLAKSYCLWLTTSTSHCLCHHHAWKLYGGTVYVLMLEKVY